MNGKKARQQRRELRQRQAAQILSEIVGKAGVSVIEVDDDRDGDIVRIVDYSDIKKGRVVFDDTGAAN